MTDNYSRIARSIDYLARRFPEPVALEALADRAGLSPAHFQKTFTRMVGVSPKKLAQHMALDHAQGALARGASVLDAAYAAGLSGPGRLHDLFVEQQAMTPGDARRQGAGLSIAYDFADGPFGEMLVGMTPRGIAAFAFVGGEGRNAVLAGFAARWPAALWKPEPGMALPIVRAVFAHAGRQSGTGEPALRLHLIGTRHQLRVWRALLDIPQGKVTSYGALAASCGAVEGAARAVAGAVGRNPIAVLIPCHRVLRASGALAGYAWGIPRKRALLAWERGLAERSVSPRRELG